MTTVNPETYLYPHYMRLRRQQVPSIPLGFRDIYNQIELGFDNEMAKEQANRCLKCNIMTVFNDKRCILCGLCVDVCPKACLKLVKLDKVKSHDELDKTVRLKFGRPLEEFQKPENKGTLLSQGTMMIKDETLCIRCGLCMKRCPADAITMEAFNFEEVLTI